MRANLNSRATSAIQTARLTALTGFLAALVSTVHAAPTAFQQLVEQLYQSTKEAYRDAPANEESGWRHARACFEWAEFAKANADRAALAEEGIAVSRELIQRFPKNAHGYYYLGMNLGQLARTRTLTALGIVDQMEEAFEKARQIDPFVDYAGPDRYLGMLYRDAPGWPASIGNRKKARLHLLKAVELRPDYPENQIALLESLKDWGDKDDFLKYFGPAAVAIDKARSKLTGDYWSGRWKSWDIDWHVLRVYKAKLDPKDGGLFTRPR